MNKFSETLQYVIRPFPLPGYHIKDEKLIISRVVSKLPKRNIPNKTPKDRDPIGELLFYRYIEVYLNKRKVPKFKDTLKKRMFIDFCIKFRKRSNVWLNTIIKKLLKKLNNLDEKS